MNCRRFVRTLPLTLLLAACVEDIEVDELVETTDVVYSPSTGLLPLPNDLLFLGTTDLTLNFPPAADPLQQGLFDALNALDGWSTSSPASISFTDAIEGDLANIASSVHLYEVVTVGQLDPADELPPIGTPVVGVVQQLTPGLDFVAAPLSDAPENNTIVVVPLAPLKPSTSYMVVVTNGINDVHGDAVSFGPEYELARHGTPYPEEHPLAGLQTLVNAMEAVAVNDGGHDQEDIILTMTFTTQSIGSSLQSTFTIANGGEAGVIAALCGAGLIDCGGDTDPDPHSGASFGGAPLFVGTTDALLSNGGTANVVTETFTLPYYLGGPNNSGGAGTLVDSTNPTAGAPLSTWWHSRYAFHAGDSENNLTAYNPLPAATRAETIPVLISTPAGAPPAGGWPCAVFQHGITSNRTAMLSVADAMANAGIACVAIDLPLHGLDSSSPFFTGYDTDTVHERTFGLDLLNNLTAASTSDGVADASGIHFINFTSLLTNRDNLSQGVSDLFNLTAALGSLDIWHTAQGEIGADGNPDIDLSQLHFIGNSLGGIVGTPFLSIQQSNSPTFQSTTMAAISGSIPSMLIGSATYGPIVQAGLGALGVFPGTSEWDQFVLAAQTISDSSDAINYATSFRPGGSAEGTALHVIEYIGGGTESGISALPDLAVPTFVDGAPLAGSSPLASLMGLTQVSSTTATNQAVVKFQEGSHSTLVNPVDLAGRVTLEAQTQMTLFALSGGTNVVITDEPLISPNPQP
ncbi:MAG: hypothetical protein MK297_01635 [Planctomycetes bacterium]|nr:hypothetical protein [Planctomycetota bacterium]